MAGNSFSRTEGRVLHEMGRRATTAAELASELGIDPGYPRHILGVADGSSGGILAEARTISFART